MEIIHIFPPNNNKYKNLLDMNDEKFDNACIPYMCAT